MCIVSFGINFLLLYYVWIIRKRFNTPGILEGLKHDLRFLWNKSVLSTIVFGSFFSGVGLVLAFFPNYWHFDPPKLQAAPRTGITDEGYPWIGAEQPELVITEFTDYQCFQCKKMHFFLRQLMGKYPDKIRLIHRHFPMDDTINPIVGERFHVGSGIMALFAEYAKSEDKFWQMNDILFKMAGHVDYINIKELAEQTGLDYTKLAHATKSSVTRYKVKHDIAVGIKLGITGTPGYLIGGKVYLGQIPPEIISSVLD
jgi:protein-disulfide isomerase